jgi:hypothetical protein
MPLPTLQFPLDGLADQVQPGLALTQGGINPANRLVIQRERQSDSPKFFSAHGSFFVCTLLTGRNIVHTI